MPKRRGLEDWLQDIVDRGERLARHLMGTTYADYVNDELLQDAASKCAEAIGEAAGKVLEIAPDFDSLDPDLRFKDAKRARDKSTHGYFEVDYERQWQTVSVAIPRTVAAARGRLAHLRDEEDGPPSGPR